MCVKLDKINETQEEQRQNILPFSFQIFFGTEYFDSSLWTVYFVSNSYVDVIILKDGIQMKDFTCCEEKRICFIFLGEYLRALGFLASVEDVAKCPRVGFLWEVTGHTSTGCSVAMCSPTGASWRMTKMSEEIPDVTWLYLHKFMFEYLLWTGSNMKHTGPEVWCTWIGIFSTQCWARQDKRVALVAGVVGAHDGAGSVNCHLLVPDNRVAAAMDTF